MGVKGQGRFEIEQQIRSACSGVALWLHFWYGTREGRIDQQPVTCRLPPPRRRALSRTQSCHSFLFLMYRKLPYLYSVLLRTSTWHSKGRLVFFFFFCLADLCLSTSSIAQSRDLLPNPHEFRPRRWSGLSICNEYSVCHSAGVDGADRVQPSPHRSIMTCAHEWGGEGRNLRYVRDARPFRIRFWLRCSEGEALGNPRQFRGARQFGTCPGRFRTKLLEPGELQTGAGWCTGHHGDLGRNGGGGTWNHPTAKFRGGSAPADKVDLAC